jgi:5-aminopentanamidase
VSVRVAGIQMDCTLGDRAGNLASVLAKLREAAAGGAKIAVYPECVLSGYGFANRADALAASCPADGPEIHALADACAKLHISAVVGFLERYDAKLYNSAAIIAPDGVRGIYRKIHLPCVGADRFADPGEEPFRIYDIDGLILGVGICFDASFPEAIRTLALLGADLVALPTNWADAARKMAVLVSRVRALENHIYFLPVNRVGTESGFHYIGHGSVVGPNGDFIIQAEHDRETIFYADIDPAVSRAKKIIHCAGEYEIDRVNWRRPEFYGELTRPAFQPYSGKHSGE